ncbi:DUF4956 domain-containing protein [Sphingomonas sp. URHD0057]|uniref:DUF4956 domain-containing protein n=1 Tax=Sphingomonas sp. URHD0057 TaxID=1380389 RepID=UPI00049126F2|nr:DUF4956 domain-containing protein [Sphingomonas sp. URHD0057]
MRASKLLVQLTAYYLIIGLVILIAVKIWPDLRGYLPIGGVEQLITQPSKSALDGTDTIRAAHVGNMGESLFWLVVAIVGALLAALPVTWVYMAVRSGEDYDQSLVNTILVLPMVVTGVVIIVQNSLALAFALAGIAGAVRFRNSLKSSGDAIFILLAVAIGLSAGIGAVELAAVISMALNYTFAVLWLTEYGEREGMKRYLADYDGNDIAAQAKVKAAKSPDKPAEPVEPA